MKIIALIIGPIGYGIVFQFFNFFNLFTSTVHLGTPVGLVARVPNMEGKPITKVWYAENYFIYFVRLFGIFSLICTIFFIFFSSYISNFLVDDESQKTAFIIIMLASPFAVLYIFIDAYLKIKELLSQLVVISILSSVISIASLYPLLKVWGLNGAAIYFLISGVLSVLIFSIYNFRIIKKIFTEKIIIDYAERNSIVKIGSVSLLSSFMFLGSFILLRKFVIENFGLTDNGVFQSIVTLSNSSFMFIYSFLSSYLLPKISKIENYSEIALELDNGFRFVLFLVIPILIFIFLYRYVLINIIYSPAFLKAGDMIFYQFIGDAFKCLSSLFGLWMIAKMRIKYIMAFDIIMNCVLLLIPFLYKYIYTDVKLQLLPIAYMIAMFIHFVFYFVYSKYHVNYRMSRNTFRTILFSLLSISFCVFIINYSFIYQYIAAPILIVLFILFSSSIWERKKALLILKEYFRKIN